ncbi:MAG: prepilin-type N-terminal cleavage/methylation domain-containing protein [Nitrospirae bacterium]|nr:prepilin-type N-terminal cleavage/methylation domain-containing protein [Nitrospirota bacterium]
MREEKGFTLIELAIVLVIIGIIIGAVLKGQDLIESARIKRFDNTLREWETSVWTYVDRKGIFPDDSDANGIIGDVATSLSAGEYIEAANFINNPDDNPLTIGSLQWWVYFGNDGTGTPKNVMVVCAAVDCNTTFDDTYVKYVESFDTIIDGTVGSDGNVTCNDGQPTLVVSSSADTNERHVTAVVTPAGQTCATSSRAIVYFFDRGN